MYSEYTKSSKYIESSFMKLIFELLPNVHTLSRINLSKSSFLIILTIAMEQYYG